MEELKVKVYNHLTTITSETINMFETIFAVTFERTNGILASTVRSAYVAIKAAFVDIDAIFIRSNDVSRWTRANVTTYSVLASLIGGAFVGAIRTLVYIDAISS